MVKLTPGRSTKLVRQCIMESDLSLLCAGQEMLVPPLVTAEIWKTWGGYQLTEMAVWLSSVP